jgi:endoglucanase
MRNALATLSLVLCACSSGNAKGRGADAATDLDARGSGGIHAMQGSGGRAASGGSAGGAGNGGHNGSTGGSGGHAASGGSGGHAAVAQDAGMTAHGGDAGAKDAGAQDAGSAGAGKQPGLHVDGNRLLGPDGKPFHGRGANLHDTRSCNACTGLPADPAGLERWSDELLDNWGSNFVRFDLEAYADDAGYRMQWKTLTDDPNYLSDILEVVSHMTGKPDVYVMVTLFLDPSIKGNNSDFDSEWPTPAAIPRYEALAETFYDDSHVLFGLTNEPHGSADHDPDLAQRYLDAIDAIRAVEKTHGAQEHVIVVQAPEGWARYLDYFVDHPIARSNVAYEVHVYNPQTDFDHLLTEPSMTLPILVGEYGPADGQMTDDDIRAMWTKCQQLEIPHIAWNFHQRCPPDMLNDTASDGCGLSASTNYNFPRTAWGDLFHDYLAKPW